MKKVFSILLAVSLVMSLFVSIAAEDTLTLDQNGFEVEYLAATAVAGILLEEAGIDNRYGSGRDGGNYIKDVALHMGPGTDFDSVAKEDELEYACAIAKFLKTKGAAVMCPCSGIIDYDSSGATAFDNSDGTVTLSITVVDLCGNGVSGLNPLTDFYVTDSVISGTFYFGTSSIPGSEATKWNEVDGVYSLILDRNFFNARPVGYNDGWCRVWNIYVKGELVREYLELKTTYYAVGDWKLDLYTGTKSNPRFIVISSHTDGNITGFFGIGYDALGTPTGVITGTISGQTIYMLYERTDIVTNYKAVLNGTIANDGNSMSGTWTDNSSYTTPQNWSMTR